MSVVVEGNILTIIIVDTRGGNNRSAKISADVFDNILVVGKRRFSVNIKAISVLDLSK